MKATIGSPLIVIAAALVGPVVATMLGAAQGSALVGFVFAIAFFSPFTPFSFISILTGDARDAASAAVNLPRPVALTMAMTVSGPATLKVVTAANVVGFGVAALFL